MPTRPGPVQAVQPGLAQAVPPIPIPPLAIERFQRQDRERQAARVVYQESY
jgi:hypothetical protein